MNDQDKYETDMQIRMLELDRDRNEAIANMYKEKFLELDKMMLKMTLTTGVICLCVGFIIGSML